MSNLTDEEWEKWHREVTSIRALPEPIDTPPAWKAFALTGAIFLFGWVIGRAGR